MEERPSAETVPFPKAGDAMPAEARAFVGVVSDYFDGEGETYCLADGDRVWVGDHFRCFDFAGFAGARELAAWSDGLWFAIEPETLDLLSWSYMKGPPLAAPTPQVMTTLALSRGQRGHKASRIVEWEEDPESESLIMGVAKDGTRLRFSRWVLRPALELFEGAHLVSNGQNRPVSLVAADRRRLGSVMPHRLPEV